MISIINQMSAAGVFTLPGIMTRQLFAGMDPIEAVDYQIALLPPHQRGRSYCGRRGTSCCQDDE